jgi:hypothetical protein
VLVQQNESVAANKPSETSKFSGVITQVNCPHAFPCLAFHCRRSIYLWTCDLGFSSASIIGKMLWIVPSFQEQCPHLHIDATGKKKEFPCVMHLGFECPNKIFCKILSIMLTQKLRNTKPGLYKWTALVVIGCESTCPLRRSTAVVLTITFSLRGANLSHKLKTKRFPVRLSHTMKTDNAQSLTYIKYYA